MLPQAELNVLEKNLPFLGQLEKADREHLLSSSLSSFCEQGDIVISRSRDCNGLVVLYSGQLRAYFQTENGKEITLYRLLPGDICILSASCVLKKIDFEVTLEAEKNSEVLFVPSAVWAEISRKSPAAREFSMELVSERFSNVMWVMEQMVSKNMDQRVSAFLLDQSELEKSDTLGVTHETIARNLGTAREVVSRTLKYLENDGLLSLSRGQIELLDKRRLREIVESTQRGKADSPARGS